MRKPCQLRVFGKFYQAWIVAETVSHYVVHCQLVKGKKVLRYDLPRNSPDLEFAETEPFDWDRHTNGNQLQLDQ